MVSSVIVQELFPEKAPVAASSHIDQQVSHNAHAASSFTVEVPEGSSGFCGVNLGQEQTPTSATWQQPLYCGAENPLLGGLLQNRQTASHNPSQLC